MKILKDVISLYSSKPDGIFAISKVSRFFQIMKKIFILGDNFFYGNDLISLIKHTGMKNVLFSYLMQRTHGIMEQLKHLNIN